MSTSVSEPEQTKEPVTINYLTSSMQYAKASSQINEELQKVYPYLTVNIEHIADNYEAVLKTKLQTDSAPDVFSWQGYVEMCIRDSSQSRRWLCSYSFLPDT